MLQALGETMGRWIKAIVLWCYGWKKRQTRSLGQLLVQWRDPHSGLWYPESTAMKIILADVMSPYNR